jgi:uncharacterized protein GlcG (DUF336 family)
MLSRLSTQRLVHIMQTKSFLELADVKLIAAAAEAEALKNNWAVTIAIADEGGNLLWLQRLDGAAAISDVGGFRPAHLAHHASSPAHHHASRSTQACHAGPISWATSSSRPSSQAASARAAVTGATHCSSPERVARSPASSSAVQ